MAHQTAVRLGPQGVCVLPRRDVNRFLRRGGGLAGLLLLVYVGVCAYMFLNQASLIYFPERTYAATPADLGMPFEEVRLRAADGRVHRRVVGAGGGLEAPW